MKILTFPVGELGVNTYIISGNGVSAAVIDPGADAEKIKSALAENGLVAESVLLTHGHFDHIGAAAELQRCGAKIYMSEKDSEMICDSIKNMAAPFGAVVECFEPDFFVSEDTPVVTAGLELRVIETPGHTLGGVCYFSEEKLFAGDTLFLRSVGRCDHYGGNHLQLINSIKTKLLCLDGKTEVYPGHGRKTTVGDEKVFNPYLAGGDFL